MGQQLILWLKAVLGRQLGGAVLQLGGPKALIRRVILPVQPLAVAAEGVGKSLHQGGVHAGIGIQSLFNVDDEGVAAPLRQRQGNELFPVEHAAGHEPVLVHHAKHLLSQLQLVPGLGIVPLGELRLVVPPERVNDVPVLRRQGAEAGLRPLGAELIDVVALAGIPASGKELQVLPVIHVVPPGPHVADPHIRIAGQQPGRLALRHHGDHRRNALLQAVGFDLRQGLVLIALRAGHRIVEYHLAVDVVAHHQAARCLRPGGMERVSPHELRAHGILAKAVIAALIIAPQLRSVLFCH